MKIPDEVIDGARVSLESPVVRSFLAEACRSSGLDPDLPAVCYTGNALFAYHTLLNAHQHAQSGEPWRNPYPDPEQTMLVEFLTPSERMRVRTSPAHLRMSVAREIIDTKDSAGVF